MAWWDIEKPWWIPGPEQSQVNPGQLMVAGAQLAQNRQKMAIEKEQGDKQIAIQQQLAEARKLAIESEVQKEVAKNQTIAMAQKGSSELANFISQTQATGKWNDPEAKAKFWEIAGRYPMIPDETVNGFWDRSFKVAEVRSEELAKWRREQGGATTDLKNAEFLQTYRDELEAAKALNDPAAVERAQQKLTDFEAMVAKSGQTIETYGPNGELVSRIVTGKGQQQTGDITRSSQAKLEQQNIDSSAAVAQGIDLIRSLSQPENPNDPNSRPIGWQALGIRGVVNQDIRRQWLAQYFQGLEPENADKITDIRTAMATWREKFIKSIKADSQISVPERKQLEQSVPSMGANESYGSAIDKIKTTMEMTRKAVRNSYIQYGKPVPDWALNVKELLEAYKLGKYGPVGEGSEAHNKVLEILKTYHP